VRRSPRTSVIRDRLVPIAQAIHRGLSHSPCRVEVAHVDPPLRCLISEPDADQLHDQWIIGSNAQAAGATRSVTQDDTVSSQMADGAVATLGDAQRAVDTRLPGCPSPPGFSPDSEQGVQWNRGLPAAVAPPAGRDQYRRSTKRLSWARHRSRRSCHGSPRQVDLASIQDRDVNCDNVDIKMRFVA
jgi:hypothetical protein